MPERLNLPTAAVTLVPTEGAIWALPRVGSPDTRSARRDGPSTMPASVRPDTTAATSPENRCVPTHPAFPRPSPTRAKRPHRYRRSG